MLLEEFLDENNMEHIKEVRHYLLTGELRGEFTCKEVDGSKIYWTEDSHMNILKKFALRWCEHQMYEEDNNEV